MKRISQAVVRELDHLAQNGLLTPKNVLDRATAANSVLHDLFTWDNDRAAHLRRLDEARGLIMSIKVQLIVADDRPAIAVRAYVSLADDRVAGTGYKSITVVMSDPSQRAQLLRTAIQELGALQKKYSTLSELAQVFAAIDQVEPEAKTG